MKKLFAILFVLFCISGFELKASSSDVFIFHDSTNPEDEVYDPSWTFVNSPSQSDMTGKFIVDKTIKKEGLHSLRLTWISQPAGDWGACVAREGWAVSNLHKYEYLSFWIYSKEIVSKEVLPVLSFESSDFKKTGKFPMADYLTTDLYPGQWIEVKIPINSLKVSFPEFPFDKMKSVFFNQGLADATQHTIYIDEIKLISDPNYQGPSEIQFFKESINADSYDPSWLYSELPSELESLNGKFKISPFAMIGTNSLKLSWKSMNSGIWKSLVAGEGWSAYDLTEMSHLSFWIYSAQQMSVNQLPYINFESHGGKTTGMLKISDYIVDFPVNQWTEIVIPLNDFQNVSSDFDEYHNIKGIFFNQGIADGTRHEISIDNIRFYNDKILSEFNPVDNKNTVLFYYSNGYLYSNGVKMAYLYDLSGRKVKDLDFTNDAVRLSVAEGFYIVSSSRGTNKIYIPR